jgi:sodium-dependent dicarboxylate transporter 2/3/5
MAGNGTGSVSFRQKFGLLLGPILFVMILVSPNPSGMPPEAQRTAAVTVLMAVLWLTEALSISATALIPIVFFPLLGIRSVTETASSYGDSNIYLFFGGFLIAAAMEKCKLHLRIAYAIITIIGKNPRQIILGFMVATASLSMWISNTATSLMMLPIGIATIVTVESLSDIQDKGLQHFGTALMLAIAYSASIGGIATIVGTPPNIVFAGAAVSLFPDLPQINFFEWFIMALPLTLILLSCTWLLLTRVSFKIPAIDMSAARETLLEKRKALGLMRTDEKKVLVVFLLTAAGWMFRRDIALGSLNIPGWSRLFANPEYINDATVAIAAALILFIIPTNKKFNDFLLTWDEAQNIPWGILILFGGGIALAGGFTVSGLSEWLGENLAALHGIPSWLFVFTITVLVTFLTEITSNVATASIFMPIMGGLAIGVGLHPYLLMLPATLSASCAFMLPVATPPNAIVFSSGKIKMADMVRAGILINIIGTIVITAVMFLIAVPLLGL